MPTLLSFTWNSLALMRSSIKRSGYSESVAAFCSGFTIPSPMLGMSSTPFSSFALAISAANFSASASYTCSFVLLESSFLISRSSTSMFSGLDWRQLRTYSLMCVAMTEGFSLKKLNLSVVGSLKKLQKLAT